MESVEEAPPNVQLLVDVAVLKSTQSTHDKRISALESGQGWILKTTVIAAIGSVGTLLMFLFSRGSFH